MSSKSITVTGRETADGPSDVSMRWVQYRRRRVHSLLRLQIANFIFLLLMLINSATIADGTGSGIMMMNVLEWMCPSVVCFVYLLMEVLWPALSRELGLHRVYTWRQLGRFIIAIRGFNLLMTLLGEGGIFTEYQSLCHGGSDDTEIAAMATMIDVSFTGVIDLFGMFALLTQPRHISYQRRIYGHPIISFGRGRLVSAL